MSAQDEHPAMAALRAAKDVVRQHNLLSTATEQDRLDTVARHIAWWNKYAFPLLYPDDHRRLFPEGENADG